MHNFEKKHNKKRQTTRVNIPSRAHPAVPALHKTWSHSLASSFRDLTSWCRCTLPCTRFKFQTNIDQLSKNVYFKQLLLAFVWAVCAYESNRRLQRIVLSHWQARCYRLQGERLARLGHEAVCAGLPWTEHGQWWLKWFRERGPRNARTHARIIHST